LGTLDEGERPWLISRRRLLERLDGERATTIALVAPAGFGKSTLAHQFVQMKPGVHAWLACTPALTDTSRLARRLVEAIDVGAESEPRSAVVDDRTSLSTEDVQHALKRWSSDSWLVIDDYEQIVGASSAEQFISELIIGTGLNTIVASRLRPTWLTARRLTYGEVAEMTSDDLAMSSAEASNVFRAIGREPTDGLISLAGGWPAALTLLALAGGGGDSVAVTLERFVADEVFESVTSQAQSALALLAGLPEIDPSVAEVLLGADLARSSLGVAQEAGILTRLGGRPALHPLVRRYLLGQPLEPEFVSDLHAACLQLASVGRWDALFAVVARTESAELMAALLTSGVRVALDEGRAADVERWLRHARERRMCAPLVSLAEAELSLRSGYYAQSEVLAADAARLLGDHPEAETWALLTAGRAAHLGGREHQAVEYYRLARTSAPTDSERREADWGELNGAIDLELPEAADLLARLRGSERSTPGDRVEVASRSLMLGARVGSLEALDEARTVVQVLPYVTDPVARTSFRNIFAYACAIAGDYGDALDALDALEADAESQHLAFALPYVSCARAVVNVGQRDFDAAFERLASAESDARRLPDNHILGMCAAIRSRALIALGHFTEAVAASSFRHPSLIKSMQAELLMTRALALACAQQERDASALAAEARSLSNAVEIVGIGACVDAINSARSGAAEAERIAMQAARVAAESRYVDGLIAAYRGFPDLARRIACEEQYAAWLLDLMRRTNDEGISRVVGLGRRGGERHLTRREAEVFALLREGCSNKEIGARLFITEDTAKQHVYKIFRKLDVKSRTEAALKNPEF
jgi:ATP/maltotriose-dependent transcriptional regulator MalT